MCAINLPMAVKCAHQLGLQIVKLGTKFLSLHCGPPDCLFQLPERPAALSAPTHIYLSCFSWLPEDKTIIAIALSHYRIEAPSGLFRALAPALVLSG